MKFKTIWVLENLAKWSLGWTWFGSATSIWCVSLCTVA